MLVAPILLAIGMSRIAAGSLIAMSAVLGEVAPPISIPVMIIGGGVDMPYIGFTIPLLIVVVPVALFTAIYYRVLYVRSFNIESVLSVLTTLRKDKVSKLSFLPLLFVLFYLISEIALHAYIPHLGVPLIFTIGSLLAYLLDRKMPFIELSINALRMAMPVITILVGVGMFLQVFALTGVRGFLAITALQLPEAVKYLAAGIMPFMGSAYASASVIGVPLVYVFLGKSTLIVTASLVMMASLGDMMPPPSLLCAYSAQTVGVKNHFHILKYSLIPIAFGMAVGILVLIYAKEIGQIFL